MPKAFTKEAAKQLFIDNGFMPTEEYVNCKTKIKCIGTDGFLYDMCLDNVMSGRKGQMVSKNNRYSIDNIKKFILDDTCGEYECLSDEFVNAKTMLKIRHLKCGRVFESSWMNMRRQPNPKEPNRHGTRCPFCENNKLESTHALVLKQVWMHEHPDTIVEEKSCRNPNNGHVMPTDIVNHALKIAIEIQSWFHDFQKQKEKDEIKKKYWLDLGYSFYAIDQRDYTVLQMIQIFFPNIDNIPDYIDFEYSNKLNDIEIQKMLNEGKSVSEISKILNCNSHTIYDAIRYGRISYPDGYKSKSCTPVLQYDADHNLIAEYESIKEAEKSTGASWLSSMFYHNRNFDGNFYWYKK